MILMISNARKSVQKPDNPDQYPAVSASERFILMNIAGGSSGLLTHAAHVRTGEDSGGSDTIFSEKYREMDWIIPQEMQSGHSCRDTTSGVRWKSSGDPAQPSPGG